MTPNLHAHTAVTPVINGGQLLYAIMLTSNNSRAITVCCYNLQSNYNLVTGLIRVYTLSGEYSSISNNIKFVKNAIITMIINVCTKINIAHKC